MRTRAPQGWCRHTSCACASGTDTEAAAPATQIARSAQQGASQTHATKLEATGESTDSKAAALPWAHQPRVCTEPACPLLVIRQHHTPQGCAFLMQVLLRLLNPRSP